MSTIVGLVVATLAAPPVAAAETMPTKVAVLVGARPEAGRRFAQTVEPSVAHGEKVLVEFCAVCHGLHGKGDGPRSAVFAESQDVPDLTIEDFLVGRDGEMKENIGNGLARFDEPAIVMPQFEPILGAADIDSVVACVETLAPPERKPEPKAKKT